MAFSHWRPARDCCLGAALGLLLAGNSSADEGVQTSNAALAPTAPPAGAATLAAVDHETEWSTTDRSRSILLRDGTRVDIGPRSRVTKQPMVTVSLGLKDAAPQLFCLELKSGTLDVEVTASKRPFYSVLVHAPRKVGAIVKTGRATVTTTATSTTVAARSGTDMNVAVSERWRPLRVGRSFSVTNSDPAGTQRPLLAAPTIHVDRPVVLALGAEAPRQRVTWREIPNSTGYFLRIYRFVGSSFELVQERRLERASVMLDALTEGRYHAKVTSIDAAGLESTESAPVQLRVVHTSLPEGAYATPDAIHLPPNTRLSLLEAEDLEMAYGTSSGIFVAAPVTVGLHDGKPVSIRLREKGSVIDTQLKLLPLDVQPRIWLEPYRAFWPGAPISIRVSLRRSNGTPLPDSAAISASVSVNAQPISVQWRRAAGILTTELEKPPFPGPWVVRVSVHDPRGHVLARDFLEVAELPRGELVGAEPIAATGLPR